MIGSRKLKGFYVTSVALFVLAALAIFWGGDPTQIYTMFAGSQGVVTAGFFGFNGLEHWAKSKAQNNGGK